MAKKGNAPQRREDPKPAPISQAIRQAGVGGITKQELNQISKDSGKSAGTVVQRLDQINKNLKENDKTGISLNSGAANMLIRQESKAQASPINQYMNKLGINQPTFGSGRIGSVLQARASGTDLLGKQGNVMLGGTAIRPGGRETVRGFGKQYELPKTVTKNPVGGDGYTPSMPKPGNTVEETIVEEPIIQEPEATAADPGPGMLSGGGMGAAGANKLGRAKSRLRKLGITGNVANQMGRGNVYRNLLNMF